LKSRTARIWLSIWIGVIILAVVPWTDLQNHSHWARVQWIPFVTPPVKIQDILVNLALYWPFGFFFRAQAADRSAWRRAAIYAVVLSLVTEWTQLYSHSRFPSLTDTTCNILGTIWGARFAVRHAAGLLAPTIEGGIS